MEIAQHKYNPDLIPKSILNYYYQLGPFEDNRKYPPFQYRRIFREDNAELQCYIEQIDFNRFRQNIEQGKIHAEDLEVLDWKSAIEYLKSYAKGFEQGYSTLVKDLSDNEVFSPTNADKSLKVFNEIYDTDAPKESGITIVKYNPRLGSSNAYITHELFFNQGVTGGRIFKAWEIILENPTQFQSLFDDIAKEIDSKETRDNKVEFNTHDRNVHEKVRSALRFMLKRDPRKQKQILRETDYETLVKWVSIYFLKDFTIPDIDIPIKELNTSKGNVVESFKRLYKELHPQSYYPDSLFHLIKVAFYDYREDDLNNLRKTKRPDGFEDLIRNKE